jgi:hypothetical protein
MPDACLLLAAEFRDQVLAALPPLDDQVLLRAKAVFAERLPNERVPRMLVMRAGLRIAVGVRANTPAVRQVLAEAQQDPELVFLTRDLLKRLQVAALRCDAMVPGAAVTDRVMLMKLLHVMLDIAGEFQLHEWIPPTHWPVPILDP